MRGNGLLDYILQFEHGAWKGVEDLRGIPANTLRPPEKCETIRHKSGLPITDGKHGGSLGSISPFDHKSSSLVPAQSTVATGNIFVQIR